jgi:hypothetical protein
MGKTKKRDLMMITLQKATTLYLSTLETERKSPRYIDWLRTRLKFFNNYIEDTYGTDFKVQDLTVEDGRDYLRSLMERNTLYQGSPMHKEKKANSKSNISTGWEGLCAPFPPGRMKKVIWMRMSCAG